MHSSLRDPFSNYFSEEELNLLFRENAKDRAASQTGDIPPQPEKQPEQEAPAEPRQPFFKENSRLLLICACLVVLVLAAGIFAYIQIGASTDPYGGKIMKNISVAGVDVGGMTERQAVAAVSAAVGDSYRQQDMVVRLPEKEFRFTPEDTGAGLDVKAAVKAAFDFGRTGDASAQQADYRQALADGYVVDLLPYMTLNQDAIRPVLDAYGAGYTGFYTPSGYTLEGEMPPLEETEFDPQSPCQTLVLNTGTSGFGFKMEDVFQQVLDAYCRNEFLVDLSDGVTFADPQPLDLEEIYEQLYIAPVEPVLDKQTYQVTPGSYGYGFDLEAAEALLKTAGAGETLRIPMEGIAPALLGDQVYFQDELGYALTPHSTNENRNNNLRLACASLNGKVLQPGETLSYNDTLGQRTAENGYLPAPAYSGTALVDSIGGGICQVSSTLYLASLYAELEIVDRINHGYPVNYIPAGLDATVNWGGPDLKVKNSGPLPVMIQAEEGDGFVKIKILGTELRDYVVRMEFRANGNYARTAICKYAPDGTLLSKTDDRISAYFSGNLSAYGEIGSGQAYINGNVKVPEFITAAFQAEE